MREHTWAYVSIRENLFDTRMHSVPGEGSAEKEQREKHAQPVERLAQHTSAYVSAYVSIR